MTVLHAPDSLRLQLLNEWQRDFPLEREPFARIAGAVGLTVPQVIDDYRALQADGSLSRIGGVFGDGAGGAALLAAMQVPPSRLEAVAAIINAQPGVNHNYQREHAWNLWFVMTGASADAVEQAMRQIEGATGLSALRLRMQRAYRIDLGFDLRQPVASRRGHMPASHSNAAALTDAEWPLAARVEAGLPLVARPFDLWADALGLSAGEVLATLQRWLRQGTLRRFGTVVRHHELGFAANAMTVFNVPDALVDACGTALAREPGVTLAYRRERAPGWPYNLYCMVHGRDRETVREVIDGLTLRCGLADVERAVLFSCRRFKQTGARRFAGAAVAPVATEAVPA